MILLPYTNVEESASSLPKEMLISQIETIERIIELSKTEKVFPYWCREWRQHIPALKSIHYIHLAVALSKKWISAEGINFKTLLPIARAETPWFMHDEMYHLAHRFHLFWTGLGSGLKADDMMWMNCHREKVLKFRRMTDRLYPHDLDNLQAISYYRGLNYDKLYDLQDMVTPNLPNYNVFHPMSDITIKAIAKILSNGVPNVSNKE